MKNNQRIFDTIVVGSGPTGSTIARELSKNNQKVLLLERGHQRKIKGKFLQYFFSSLFPGTSLKFTTDLLSVTRGLVQGGSSTQYCATAFQPPIELFKKLNLDITKEYEEVKKEVPIAKLHDNLIGPMAKTISASARELGINWEKFDKFIDQKKCKTNCVQCNYGCPYSAKWTARDFANEAITQGAVFKPKSTVLKIIKENHKATGVYYKDINYRQLQKAYAKNIIISAGGIGSPAILRASGIKNAGNNFFFDPLFCANGSLKNKEFTGKELQMTAGIHMKKEGFLLADWALPFGIHVILNSMNFKLLKIPQYSKMLRIMIKIEDDLGGKIGQFNGIRKRLSQKDKQKLTEGQKIAESILRQAGAKNIQKSMYMASHPGGTCKIGEIVDTNFETSIKNMFVCDCSVIPQSWGLPPTLTLLCLGKKLAKSILSG